MSAPPHDAPALGQDLRTIGLVGLAHGCSHFFHMLLPPLFPLFIRDFGLRYAELGLLVTVFFAISGVGQALAGFVVDRVGARPVLFAALGCFVLAALAAATAQGYAGLALAAALAGLGNAPFHPVDFTILNRRVSTPRLGHAFSVHGISGNLGWAAAPAFLAALTVATGSWRAALTAAAGLGAGVILLLWWQRAALDDGGGAAAAAGPAAAPREHALAFLARPSVWLCFAFFFWASCALSAMQGFASPALQQLYGLPLTQSAAVITGFMLCGAAGMFAGGFLAARAQHLERLIGACLVGAALALGLVATGALPGVAAGVVAALAGLGTGLAGPSRDLLIRRAAPPGATGRVYGTVYSGMDLGFALAAPVFGGLLDRGAPAGVFFGAAVALVLGALAAGLVGRCVAQARVPPAAKVAA